MKKFLILFCLALAACSSGSSGNSFKMRAPQELTTLGIPLTAYVFLSTDPANHLPLQYMPATDTFHGEFPVPGDTDLDLTVVFEGSDPLSGQNMEVSRFTRKGLHTEAHGVTPVNYTGDENDTSWETVFDFSPGTPNALNLDGDAFGNFVEIGYGSDPTKADSLPSGPKISVTRKDQVVGSFNISLPEAGAATSDLLSGAEEILVSADTPFKLKNIEILSPSFGTEVLSTSDEIKNNHKARILLHTDYLLEGTGPVDLRIRVTDKYGMSKEFQKTIGVSNPTTNNPPARTVLNITAGQVLTGIVPIDWEIIDATGIDTATVSAALVSTDFDLNQPLPITDTDTDARHVKAHFSVDADSLPNGNYALVFNAKDIQGHVYTETIPVVIRNTANAVGSGAVPRILFAGQLIANNQKVPEGTSDGRSYSVVLDASRSAAPDGSTGLSYLWSCTGNNFTFNSTKSIVTMGLPDISRNEGERVIACSLTISKGAYQNTSTVPVVVQFADRAPLVSNITFTQNTVVAPNLPTPTNFKITWTATDADGAEINQYTLEFIPEGATGSRLACSIPANSPLLKSEGANRVSIASQAAIDGCLITTPGYGELGNPFTLSPRTTYQIIVTATDLGGVDGEANLNATVRDNNLAAWWHFNEGQGNTISDASGNGNTGTLSTSGQGLPTWTSGVKGGSSLTLDGRDDYVNVPDSASLNLGSGDWTLEAWVKGPVNNTPLIISYNGLSGNQADLTGNSQGVFGGLFVRSPSANDVSLAGATAEENATVWHHVVGTRSATQFLLYVDGELEDAQDEYAGSVTLNGALKLGSNYGRAAAGYSYFQGSLDEVAIYKRALSIDEVRRDCRRNDPTGTTCANVQEPIITTPLPNQVLPPTRLFLSWRGERDAGGEVINQNTSYLGKIDVDGNQNGSYNDGDDLPNIDLRPTDIIETEGMFSTVVDNIILVQKNRNYTVSIRTTNNVGSQFSINRIFSTDDSVLAWWKLDGNFQNSASNQYHSNPSGNSLPISILEGGSINGLLDDSFLDSRVYYFDGNNDYAIIGDVLDGLPELTVEARIKTATVANFMSVVSKWGPGSSYLLRVINGIVTFSTGTTSTGQDNRSVSTVTDGNWHHLVGTYDGARQTLNIDGVQEDSDPQSGSIANTSEILCLGAMCNTAGSPAISTYYTGLLDEVLIYDEGLTPGEVRNNYCAIEALNLDVNEKLPAKCLP